jgi:hypothetical protein
MQISGLIVTQRQEISVMQALGPICAADSLFAGHRELRSRRH